MAFQITYARLNVGMITENRGDDEEVKPISARPRQYRD
jgi:hypothetical protein